MRSVVLTIVLIILACSPSAPGQGPQAQSGVEPVGGPPQKPLIIALSVEPASLDPNLSAGSNNRDFGVLANGFLVYHEPPQLPRPYLAAELPSVERGSWKVLPEGGMEVSYQLRRNARWHDGRPITAHDFTFAHRVRTEGVMPVQFGEVERRVGRAVASDDFTLLLSFEVAYLWAGQIHGPNFAPMHRELLETLYVSDREAFLNTPIWREQYVGSGPYRLERWEQGVQIAFRAHEAFVLGKPKIDQIVVRFILDANTIVANVLGGAIDMSFSVAIGFPQAQTLERSAADGAWQGSVAYWRGGPRFLEFQQRDWGNLQRAVLDVRVRRALLHALDRRVIVDILYAGKTESPHFWLASNDPAYPAVDRAVSKYQYDPARAEALLREAGWARGGDGIARGSADEPLALPMLTLAGDIEGQEANVVANFWKAVGGVPAIQTLTPQEFRDGEFRAKFPAVSYGRRGWGYDSMAWTREDLAVPETRWRGSNRGGYVNPALEEAWRKVLATVDDREREAHLIEGLKIMTADAVVTPTHLQPRSIAHRSGLAGIKEPWIEEGTVLWNVWEWEWR